MIIVNLDEDFEYFLFQNLKSQESLVTSVYAFQEHLETYGFTGLVGRNKKSYNENINDPNRESDNRYVDLKNLWHYHLGIPSYNKSGGLGKWTSSYVLNYTRNNDLICFFSVEKHPPFKLPFVK